MAEDSDEQRFMKIKIPLYFDAMVPITVKLLKKQKDIKELDDELALQREEFNTRMRKAKKRRAELEEKEQLLVQSLKEYEEFIEDRERKRLQSESKYAAEKQRVEEIDEELQQLQQEREVLSEKKETLEKCLEKCRPAYEFLERVAKESVQFEEVGDIISFYDTLVAVNEELEEYEEEKLRAIDAETEKLTNFKTEMQNQLLTVSNRLYELQKEWEKTHDQVLALEAHYSDINSSNNKKAMTLGQIFMAICSMYMTICEFEKVTFSEKDPLKQMEKVHEFIQDWSEVVPEAEKVQEQEYND